MCKNDETFVIFFDCSVIVPNVSNLVQTRNNPQVHSSDTFTRLLLLLVPGSLQTGLNLMGIKH